MNAVWSSDEGNQLEYVDVYKAAPTAVSLEAVEVLTGRELKDGEFSFLLKDKDGNVLQTVQNDAKGQIKLKKIKYDKVGETTYTLEQVKGEEKNMQYDDTVYEITVQVTDDELGHLIPEITIKDAQSMVFHNEYTEPEKPSDQDKKPDEDDKESDEAGTSPRTGDVSSVALWLILAMVSLSGIEVCIRMKKNRNI